MEELNYFTKNLKILFVEDDELTRKQFVKILGKIFINIEIESNGLDGFLKFQERHLKNENYDLIISDIDMPRMSGLEMIEKIREMDTNVPVIFITAKNNAETLLKAIQLGVLNFVPKPIDIENLIENIKKSCEKLHFQHLYSSKSNELEKYYRIIEEVALVTRSDLEGNITYINDNFLQVSGYEKEELIGKNHSIFKSQDNKNETFYEHLWKKIKNGQIWSGSFKNIDKNGEIFYRKASIVPILGEDNQIKEYMSISFLTTDEEKQKRMLNEKLIKNIVSHRKEIHETSQSNNKYQEEIKSLKTLVIALDTKVKKMNAEKLYTVPPLNETDSRLEILKQKNEEVQAVNKANLKLKEENRTLSQEKRELEEKVTKSFEAIEAYKKEINSLKNRLR